jgi:hypothetical protein
MACSNPQSAEHARPGAFDRQAAYTLYQQLLGHPSIQFPGLLVTSPPAGGRAKDTIHCPQ